MPDAFGFETPQEVMQRLRAERALRSERATESRDPGIQFGQALANIFGPAIQKTLDTGAARRSETERLVAQGGISRQEARELAKANVPRDFAQVRRAKQLQAIQSGGNEIVAKMTPEIGAANAQAAAMIDVAQKLRAIPGMEGEATRLTIEAGRIKEAEVLRVAELDRLKASTRASTVSADLTEAQIPQVGKTGIGKLLDEREVLIANIDDSEDSSEVRLLEHELKITDAKIAKEIFITGSTETDLLVNPSNLQRSTLGALETSLIESGNQLDLLTSIGETFKPEFLTFFGQAGAKLLDLAEKASIPLSAGGKKNLAEFSAFKRNSLDGLNRYIKLITGAQMSEAEASRLRKAFPDVEQDGPTTFMSKYVEVIRQVMAVRARAQQALAEGSLGVLPGDMKGGFGQDLSGFIPTNEEARTFLGMDVADIPAETATEIETAVPNQLPRDKAVDDSLLIIQDLLKTAGSTSIDGS